jgi:hypothetical protein
MMQRSKDIAKKKKGVVSTCTKKSSRTVVLERAYFIMEASFWKLSKNAADSSSLSSMK